MIKNYYTSVTSNFGKILYRGYSVDDSGKRKRVHAKLEFKPTLYLESTEEKSDLNSLYRKPLKQKHFDSMSDARQFIKDYKDVMPIYGYSANRTEYEFIARNFPEVMDVLLEDLKVIGFDIETKVGVNGPAGFPDPQKALEEITHIPFEDLNTGRVVSYTTANISIEDTEDTTYVRFNTEKELLYAIIKFIEFEDPDIIYGFYSEFFDVPYLINRLSNVLGENVMSRLSPFGIVDVREYELKGKIYFQYNIIGRTLFDTQAMYKKFVLTKRDHYSLDHLSKIELGEGKLENPCTTFKEFSESVEHIDRFALYNVIDTK